MPVMPVEDKIKFVRLYLALGFLSPMIAHATAPTVWLIPDGGGNYRAFGI